VKKVLLFKKNILYYMGMGEDQNKSDEDRFEEGLRQILSNSQPPGDRGTAGEPPNPSERLRAEGILRAAAEKAEKESKALFWFKLLRLLAIPALLLFLAKFVLRITAAQ